VGTAVPAHGLSREVSSRHRLRFDDDAHLLRPLEAPALGLEKH